MPDDIFFLKTLPNTMILTGFQKQKEMNVVN